MEYLGCVSIGYLIGAFNPAYILSKLKGFDIRQRGSGNAGASNALIVFGKLVGVICALLDIAKTCLAIWLTGAIFPGLPFSFVLTGSSCILGHIFPFYMRFRGGKGLACLGGMILMFDWRVFLIMLAVEAVIVLVTGYLCFVPMSASVIFSVTYGIMRRDLIGAAILLAVAAVILFRHKENIKRIRAGIEARFSYLWNKEKEIERLKKNSEK
ncbi:MAG: glycerol-3-phosphate acyltransferase [Clostridia bacterium]|nr:glycerol-3-phosphate acyltransferase [Clostridia bacterium]